MRILIELCGRLAMVTSHTTSVKHCGRAEVGRLAMFACSMRAPPGPRRSHKKYIVYTPGRISRSVI